jgi:hypothetical protein
MPQNTPYPGETPQQFQMRMMQGGGPPPGAQQSPMRPPPMQGVPQGPGMLPPGMGGPQAPQAPQAGQPDQSRMLEEALLGTYGDVMENDALGEQMARADALRNTASPEMRGNGRVQTAANPMEFIGRGMQQWEGRKRANAIEGQQAATRGRIGEAVKKYGLNLPE